jgi:hypothetical protein
MASGAARQTGTDGRVGELTRLVVAVRGRIIAVSIATGLLLVLALAVGWIVGSMVLDLAAPLAVPLRMAVWTGWWVAVAAGCLAFLAVPAWRRPVLDAVALRIERALGGMQNRLLTVLDLGRDPSRLHRTRPDLLARLLEQTHQRVRAFRPGSVIRWRSLARGATLAAGALAAGLVLFAWFGDRFTTTFERLLHPTADIPPATFLQFTVPGDIEALVDEPLEISAAVARGTCSAAELVLEDGAGRHLRYPMRPGDGGFVVRLEGLDEDVRYRVEGGGTWTRTHAIRLLARPAIEELSRAIRLPAYMRIDEPLPVIGDPPRIDAPEGSAVEFTARVRPEPAAGHATLLDRTFVSESVDTFDERVWFEDDLPRDAVFPQPWRWTTAHAAGGLRGFQCEDGRPAGLRTRLEPLVLPKEAPADKGVMVMARTDPAAPPRRIAIVMDTGPAKVELVWGDGGGTATEGVQRFVAGPLPEPGQWARLWAPLASLPALAGRSVTAATFRVDGGRAVLDRPGWLTRGARVVERTVDREAERVPAARLGSPAPAAAAAPWRVAVPVDRRRFVTLSFEDAHGHPSLPVPPVELAPTVDRPPALVITAPGDMLALELPDDVVIRGEAFDDWGIDQIAVRIGPDADHLSAPEALTDVPLADRPPDSRVVFSAVLPAERLGLEPGRGAAWKLVVRDTKGQVVESALHRVTVALPPDHALAKSQVPALDQARRLLEQAAAEAGRNSATLDAARDALLEAVGRAPVEALTSAEQAAREAAEKTPDGQVDPARTQAAAERAAAAQSLADEATAALDQPRKKDMQRLDQYLEARRGDAQRAEEALQRAAEQARASSLVPQPLKEELDRLADAAGQLRDALEKSPAVTGEAAKLERIASAPEPTAIAVTAEQLAAAVKEAGQRIDAAGAARRLDGLAQDLGQRAEALADIARQRGVTPDALPTTPAADPSAPPAPTAPAPPAPAPAERTPAAESTPRDPPAPTEGDDAANSPAADPATRAERRRVERQAVEQLRQVEQILGEPVGPAADRAAVPTPTPPAPPANATGRPDAEPTDPAQESPPVAPGRNTAEPSAPDAGAPETPGSAAAAADPLAARLEAGEAAAAAAARMAQSFAGQLSGRVPLGAPESPAAPATDQSAADQSAADRAAPGPESPAASGSPATPRDGAPAPAGDQPGAAAPTTIEDLLASPDVQDALRMADRARRLQLRQARQQAADAGQQAGAGQQPANADETGEGQPGEGQPGDQGLQPGDPASEGGSLNGRRRLDPAALRGLDAKQRAALERLPPRVRDPLLEGMREEGPEAYRGVIETYFRRLGNDVAP